MLKVDNLKKSFGSFQAVKGISFTVEKGEVLGFLGPNGAGKSTTMRMITGFIPPTAGTAEICGHDIIKDPVGAKSCLGYLPENAPSYRSMTVTDFLTFIASVRGFAGAKAKAKVDAAIEKARLATVAKPRGHGRVNRKRRDTAVVAYKARGDGHLVVAPWQVDNLVIVDGRRAHEPRARAVEVHANGLEQLLEHLGGKRPRSKRVAQVGSARRELLAALRAHGTKGAHKLHREVALNRIEQVGVVLWNGSGRAPAHLN